MFILMIETDKQANNYNMLMKSDRGMSRKKVGEQKRTETDLREANVENTSVV